MNKEIEELKKIRDELTNTKNIEFSLSSERFRLDFNAEMANRLSQVIEHLEREPTEITSLVVFGDHLFVGSMTGLFMSVQKGGSITDWKRMTVSSERPLEQK